MNTETKQEALSCNLAIIAEVNRFNGAQYYSYDLDIMNVKFDAEWEVVHGYHPIEAADWERGFNLNEGA